MTLNNNNIKGKDCDHNSGRQANFVRCPQSPDYTQLSKYMDVKPLMLAILEKFIAIGI